MRSGLCCGWWTVDAPHEEDVVAMSMVWHGPCGMVCHGVAVSKEVALPSDVMLWLISLSIDVSNRVGDTCSANFGTISRVAANSRRLSR